MSEQLRPCFRCEGIAEVICSERTEQKHWYVECRNTDCDETIAQFVYSSEDEAITTWNTRPIEDTLRNELAAEREKVSKLSIALRKIGAIEDKHSGGDWDEIEEARAIASRALTTTDKEKA